MNGTGSVDRLVACGYAQKEAERIFYQYINSFDFYGLERFIRKAELLLDDRKQYV